MERVIKQLWNGKWGRLASKKIWLRQLADETYEVTWRGGDYTDRDGRLTAVRREVAEAAVRALREDAPDATWRDLTSLYQSGVRSSGDRPSVATERPAPGAP
jgi:hypothetical protein